MKQTVGSVVLVFCMFAAMGDLPSAQAVEPEVLQAEKRRVETVQQLAPAVVSIFGQGGGGGGSGVLISPDGYALSNFHVTSGVGGGFMKCGLNDGVLYDAVIVGVDPTGDVALIKLLSRDDFPYARFGDSDTLKAGDWVFAMGNPFLLATDFQPTVTYGIVSGVHRYQYPAGSFLEYTDCIQVDASINPGNSGGPLFSEAGKLVGINGRGSFEKRGRVNSGAGYAISINQIKHFLDHLKSGRVVDHASLGATVTSDADGAVIVNNILEDSEAYRRGLRVGDELVSFAGRPMRSVNQFKNILGIYPKGWTLPLTYRREQEKHRIYVRLQGLHRESELRRQSKSRPKPQPKPEPKPEKPEDKQPRPIPELPFHQQAEKKPPEKYAHMYVPKPGFANYYFNQLQQKPLLATLQELGDFGEADGTWTMSGTTEAGQSVRFTLAEKGVGLELGGEAFFQPLDGSDPKDEPPQTGGLLTAWHHFRLLLNEGQSAFTEFYYLGREPLDGRKDDVDVLVTTLTAVETHWYFRQSDGRFMGFDTWLQEDVDPCVVRIADWQEFNGRRLPGRFHVRHGGDAYATFQLETVELAGKGE